MKVSDFIKWLETKDQNLQVYVVEHSEGSDWHWDGQDEYKKDYTMAQAVCFDDVERQSTITKYSLTLGIEES